VWTSGLASQMTDTDSDTSSFLRRAQSVLNENQSMLDDDDAFSLISSVVADSAEGGASRALRKQAEALAQQSAEQARERMLKQWFAGLTIQSAQRARVARDLPHRHRASTKLQTCSRRWLAIAHRHRTLQAVRTLQAPIRSQALARRRRTLQAARVLQASIRSKGPRQQLAWARSLATALQSRLRERAYSRRVGPPARFIQSCYRAYAARFVRSPRPTKSALKAALIRKEAEKQQAQHSSPFSGPVFWLRYVTSSKPYGNRSRSAVVSTVLAFSWVLAIVAMGNHAACPADPMDGAGSIGNGSSCKRVYAPLRGLHETGQRTTLESALQAELSATKAQLEASEAQRKEELETATSREARLAEEIAELRQANRRTEAEDNWLCDLDLGGRLDLLKQIERLRSLEQRQADLSHKEREHAKKEAHLAAEAGRLAARESRLGELQKDMAERQRHLDRASTGAEAARRPVNHPGPTNDDYFQGFRHHVDYVLQMLRADPLGDGALRKPAHEAGPARRGSPTTS